MSATRQGYFYRVLSLLMCALTMLFWAGCSGGAAVQNIISQVNTPSNATVGVASVAGTVTDGAGTGMEGVQVMLGNVVSISGPGGAYSLSGLTAGSGQTITAQMAGFRNYTGIVDVPAGTSTTCNISMEAAPADSGTATGIVTDAPTGSTIQGVLVTIDAISSYTDAAGNYAIFGISPGVNKVITATRSGYQNYTGAITINTGASTIHNIILER
jgi:hypothetical protein